jgi:hypothetical protein
VEPYFLKVYNVPRLDSPADLESYVGLRANSLQEIAAAEAETIIGVSISPNELLDIDDLIRMRDNFGIDITELNIEVYLDGVRKGSMFFGSPNEPGERSKIDFNSSLTILEASIRNNLPIQIFDDVDDPGNRIQFKTGWLRGHMTASQASKLNSDSVILLVDPINDLADAFTGRTAELEIIDLPHLYFHQQRLNRVTGVE